MLILIVLLPLFGFFSGIFFGRYLNVCFISTFCVFNSFFFSFILFLDILANGINYKLVMGSWINIEMLQISWSFLFDSLTSIMLIVVTFISSLVHLYSTEYMENDPHLNRFMSYLSLFTFFMLILVTGNNFLQMFVGWEGVGLSSYLLINFWFTRIQANKAAIKAMLINRIGDFALLIAIFLIYITFGNLNYDIVFGLIPEISYSIIIINNMKFSVIDLICLLLFIGAMGKSAQLGLHVWLPDAMEGPTPVSALIHAATMVTAGIFLISRCSYLFEFSPVILTFIIVIGSATAFGAATIGLFQNDIKKVIAYSTCSQLGYMVFACGLSSYEVGLFHLSNHAFFKALLFLGAGSIIHAVNDEQDMRKMGGLQRVLPLSYAMILIGSLALIGFPFLTGFYSKDAILELAYAKYTYIGHHAYFLGTLAAFCTAFYSTRLIYLVFLSQPNGNKVIISNAHEPSWKMVFPLCLLCFLSINIGYLTKDIFIGFGTNFWGSSLFVLPNNYLLLDSEFIPIFFKLLPLIFTFLGIFLAYFTYSNELEVFYKIKFNKFFNILFVGLNKKWFFDRIYTEFVTQNVLKISYFFSYQKIDRGLIEQFGPFGIVNFFKKSSNFLFNLQNGSIFHYFIILFFSLYITFLI
jgi:NADH-ubiquinone oxidoreductase chain 5